MMKMMNPSSMNSMMNYQPNSEFNIKFQTEINETLGNEGLIFISKSKEYSKKKKIPLIKLLQYYELLRANKTSFNNQNCKAVCLYFLCKYATLPTVEWDFYPRWGLHPGFLPGKA